MQAFIDKKLESIDFCATKRLLSQKVNLKVTF